jgi:ATP-binding cassette, subfamily C, type I secretion system permease/ATPase
MISPGVRFSALPTGLQGALISVRSALFATAMASGLINLLMLVGPIFMLQTYDRVLPSRSISTLVGLLLIALVLLIIQAAVDMLRSRLLARMAEMFDETIRADVSTASTMRPSASPIATACRSCAISIPSGASSRVAA